MNKAIHSGADQYVNHGNMAILSRTIESAQARLSALVLTYAFKTG